MWFAIDEDGHELGHGSALMTRSLVAKLAGRWLRRFGQVRTYYEAGPCGYWLHRVLEAAGVKNTVVAPALTPRAPGEKVKTDRRDAAKLARMGMRGMLTAVYVPDRDHEALRDLLRLRKAARDEVRRVKTRITHYLNRQGIQYRDGRRWTGRHRRWLASLRLQWPQHIVLEELLRRLSEAEVWLRRVERRLRGALRLWRRLSAIVEAFQAVRGVGYWTAVTVVLAVSYTHLTLPTKA